ncbi:hypothetical protein EGM51_03090 [Verrucomicrobia bacterium S94]|nr:hypothetical protein EGM51_03090 [Verrucomicrobia bacterium S94]
MFRSRKKLPHEIPAWVKDGSAFFITICTEPKGKNQLCNAEVFDLLCSSLKFRMDRGELWVYLLVLMPDHLHTIMSFSCQTGMQKPLANWKRYTCIKRGIKWQRDFFDHRLRNDESYMEKASYIRMNPVRAGLCEKPEDWPYIWENRNYKG